MTSTAIRKVPTTLILDFHDSYTRNVLQLVASLNQLSQLSQIDDSVDRSYEWNLRDWQERVVVINVDSLSWTHFTESILPLFDCIVLGPGPGTPHSDDDFCWARRLILEFGGKVPIFGLCLGCQGLATAFGGTVGKGLQPVHGQISQIVQTPTSASSITPTYSPIFSGVPDRFSAVQYNSLVVDGSNLPRDLVVTAESQNGEIMGLAAIGKPLWGVQFHPESICSTFGSRIIDNFLRLSLAHLDRADHPSSSTSRPCKANLPPSILRLATTFQPRRPRSIIPSDHQWERRSVKLGSVRSSVEEGSPQRIFEELVKGKCDLGEVWLESARPTGVPQFSHLFNPSSTLSYCISHHTLQTRYPTSNRNHQDDLVPLDPSETIFDDLSRVQTQLQRSTSTEPASATAVASVPIGFVGYIGYEMKQVTLPHCRPEEGEEDELPGTEFAFANKVLTFAHGTKEWYASGLVRIKGTAESDRFGIDEEDWKEWIDSLESYFSEMTTNVFTPIVPVPLPSDFGPDQSRSSYMASIESARTSIIAGNAYELCLTTQFRSTLASDCPLVSDPYPLYLSLRQTNPAPYSAYFHLPRSDLTIMSSSPERFLRNDRNGQVSMKPIKGTVRRHLDDPVEDRRRKESLEADEKERAENLMIVDLIRNDLLGFCENESVEVTGLMKIESYETVHQMVTTVVGQLRSGVTPFDAVSQAFPPGSMTGAPKLRSVQLLEDLERHKPRGIYSGCFGYVSVDGTSDWSVVIRTLVKRGRELTLGAGGAITHLSDPAKEWEEVLTKIDAVLGGRFSSSASTSSSTSSSS